MLSMKQDMSVGVQQLTKLQLSFAMQQAIQILQMPILELTEWLKGEIDMNPCLEYPEGSAKSSFIKASSLKSGEESVFVPSLFEHLMEQARLSFTCHDELVIAEQLIGSLDERGFLTASDVLPHMNRVLEKIQLFDPPGIAAKSLKESLLIQLRLKHLENSLAYELIRDHYENLLQNRLPLIAKKTGATLFALKEEIEGKIAPLNLRPAARFHSEPMAPITPDIILTYEDEKWSIEPNEECYPSLQINSENSQNHYYLQQARFIKKALLNRQKTLLKICHYFVKRQGHYLSSGSASLEPMTMQEVADALNLHISTIGRAVGQKHLSCPRGMISMRSLFSYDLGNATSNHSVKQLLSELIKEENKEHPLSDDALALKISASGIPIARRTVAKYRNLLKIPAAKQRRHW